MAQQTHAEVRRRRRLPAASTEERPKARPESAEIVEVSDELLDEIDAVLGEEEEFAVRYRQRGGQ